MLSVPIHSSIPETSFNCLKNIAEEHSFCVSTIFQTKLIGQTHQNELFVYDPETKEKYRLDVRPPFNSKHPGKFLVSRQTCIFNFDCSRFYQIDLTTGKAEELAIKAFKSEKASSALLDPKLYNWIVQTKISVWMGHSKEEPAIRFLIKVFCFDLLKKTTEIFSYFSNHKPQVDPEQFDCIMRAKKSQAPVYKSYTECQ